MESSADAGQRFRRGEVIVRLRPGASIAAINARYGTVALEQISGTRIFRVKGKRIRSLLEKLRQDPDVQDASQNAIVGFRNQTHEFPGDDPAPVDGDGETLYHSQQFLDELRVSNAADLVAGGKDIVVAVLDTGIDWRHPALAGRIATTDSGDPIAWDFVDDDADPDESSYNGIGSGHGTFVAGLITLAARRAQIMPLRILGPDGTGSAYDAAAAINFASQHGARVINMSFGAIPEDAPEVLKDAIRSARSLGIVMVTAAGNDGKEKAYYPAFEDGEENVISVAATDGLAKASFSNYGEWINVSAPGVALISAMPGTESESGYVPGYAVWSGTSFSTAIVSGAAAVLLSVQDVEDPASISYRVFGFGDVIDDTGEGGAFENKLGKRVNFFESVSGLLADTGNYDVWSHSPVQPNPDVDYEAGGDAYVRLVGAGAAQKQFLTFHACGLIPDATYDFYADQTYVASTLVDAYGNADIVVARTDTPIPGQVPLPPELDSVMDIYAAGFVEPWSGQPACYALLDRTQGAAQIWVSVGTRDAFGQVSGRSWYWFDSEHQYFQVTVLGLERSAGHVLNVNGGEVVSVEASEDGAVDVYYTDDEAEIAECDCDGAIRLPDAMHPLSSLEWLELVDTSGNQVAYADFSGANARVIELRKPHDLSRWWPRGHGPHTLVGGLGAPPQP
jgi:thermitase